MATTTNYAWETPDDTDLVKDGAAAIRTLGSSIDTTTKALNPSTTLGDIEYRSSTANTNTRLGIGTTGQVLTVSGGVPAWANASAGSTNVAGKNAVLNSNFSIWQRGTSIAQTAAIMYGADRWCSNRGGLDTGSTISRQATGDTSNLPNIQYCARVQRNNANASTNIIYFSQTIESVNSIPYAGKTITFSFYARAGANYSSASNALSVTVSSGTGTDQNILSTYTGAASAIGGTQTATLTTTWQRFTYSGTVASTATQLGFYFNYTPVGTAGAADYFEVTGVQLEIASSASAYSPNASTQALELAACQRYYFKDAKVVGQDGYAQNATTIYFKYYHPVAMRTTPTYTQTGAASFSSNTSATIFTTDANGSNELSTNFYFLVGASNGYTYLYRTVEWSAEL